MHTTNINSETFEPLLHDMEKQLNKLLTDMILYSASEGKLTAEIDVDYTTMEDGHGIVPMFDFKVSTNIPIKKRSNLLPWATECFSWAKPQWTAAPTSSGAKTARCPSMTWRIRSTSMIRMTTKKTRDNSIYTTRAQATLTWAYYMNMGVLP